MLLIYLGITYQSKSSKLICIMSCITCSLLTISVNNRLKAEKWIFSQKQICMSPAHNPHSLHFSTYHSPHTYEHMQANMCTHTHTHSYTCMCTPKHSYTLCFKFIDTLIPPMVFHRENCKNLLIKFIKIEDIISKHREYKLPFMLLTAKVHSYASCFEDRKNFTLVYALSMVVASMSLEK